MYRIIGLWNNDPKEKDKYQNTPHNIGGQILRTLFDNEVFENISNSFYYSKTRRSNIAEGFILDKKSKKINFEIILPEMFINNSGNAFSGIFKNNGRKDLIQNIKEIEKIIVIYDDIALPFGNIKISFNRGDAGHNGIKDITEKLGTKNYIRLRIGICPIDFFGRARKPKTESMAKYLTSKEFSRKQTKQIPEIEKKVESVLKFILKNGYKETMNKHN